MGVADMAFKAITASVQGGSALHRHLLEIERRLGQGAHVGVGFFASEKYPEKEGDTSLPVAQVAFWNQYGTLISPARPFITTMLEKRSPRWGVGLGNALRKADYDATVALAAMGEVMQGQMRKEIQEWTDPPNADSTIAKKKSSKPLIDTGQMYRAVDFQVLTGVGDDD